MKSVAVVLVLCILSACECTNTSTGATSTHHDVTSATSQKIMTSVTTKGPTSSPKPTTEPTTEGQTSSPKPTTETTTKAETSSPKPTTEPTTKGETSSPKPTTEPTTKGQTSTAHQTTTHDVHTTSKAEVTTEHHQTTSSTAKPPTEPPLFYIRDSKNVTCILLQLNANFNISYMDSDMKQAYKNVHLDEATATGNCSYNDSTQVITIPIKSIGGSVTWLFGKGKKYGLGDSEYAVVQQELMFSFKYFKKAQTNDTVTVVNSTVHYNAYVDNAYNCTNQADMTFKKINVTSIVMHTKRLTTQAFRSKTSLTFSGKMQVCAADQKTSNIVPIAVGAALAGLVVIVLIAYLIGRRRNKKGYESV